MTASATQLKPTQITAKHAACISKKGVTSSTFKTVPDVPVGTFQLYLPEGANSALAANGALCKAKKLTMPTVFDAQDGASIHTTTPIQVTGCAAKSARTARSRPQKSKTVRRAAHSHTTNKGGNR